MSLFDKIKKMFGAGGAKPQQAEISKPEPAKKSDSSTPSADSKKPEPVHNSKPEPVKKAVSPGPSAGMTAGQNKPDERMLSNLQCFLTLIRLDMLVNYGIYNLNLDPDDDSAFVSLNGFGVGMEPARTLYGAYKDIDRRMGGNWSFVKFRCEAKENRLSLMAKSPLIEMRKWEEIRQTVSMDMLKETGSNAAADSERIDKQNFYTLCMYICNEKLQQLQNNFR